MATYYVLCHQSDGLPLETVTDDYAAGQDFSISGRLWASQALAEKAAHDFLRSVPSERPLMLRTVEL